MGDTILTEMTTIMVDTIQMVITEMGGITLVVMVEMEDITQAITVATEDTIQVTMAETEDIIQETMVDFGKDNREYRNMIFRLRDINMVNCNLVIHYNRDIM